jgi:EcsC protein family
LFGWAGFGVELPVSTTIILRSIADIARAEGENLQNPEACLACIEVFALGGRTASDDAAESGYFAVRAALARAVSEAAAYVAERGVAEEAAPALIRLVAKIAQRFAPAVADKLAAQAAPLFGAVGGAGVNLIFISHFQTVAQGHFTVRRLERKYGPDRVRQEYEQLRR